MANQAITSGQDEGDFCYDEPQVVLLYVAYESLYREKGIIEIFRLQLETESCGRSRCYSVIVRLLLIVMCQNIFPISIQWKEHTSVSVHFCPRSLPHVFHLFSAFVNLNLSRVKSKA